METFHPAKLDKPHHHHHHLLHPPPAVEFLPGGARYGAKSHGAHGNAFNSWNDYLGLATLVTKAALGQEKGFCGGPSPVGGQPGEEDDDDEEEEDEDEEEDDDDDDGGAPYFESALDLRDFDLCSHHHQQQQQQQHRHQAPPPLLSPGESLLEERFADFSPFSGRGSPASSLVFNCSPDPLEKDRSAAAWGARLLVDGRLPPGAPKTGSRLLKPELQVCVFCRNNKEAVALYTTHILKGPDGRVLCPVLRRYTCPLCGASGDNAHTIKYCPLSKMHGGGGGGSAPKQPLKSARHILGKKLR